jgi:uncharacterized repeat protein (TIGR01451 family)
MLLARRISFILAAVLFFLGLAVSPAQAVSPNIDISQVYGGAGCGTAGCSTYKNDYIELFNRGAVPVSVNGWSVQYAAATGTAWQVTNLPNVSIPAGGYLLVAESLGANGVNNLPAPDVTGTIAMSATAGKVALVNTTVALSGACPASASLVDLVGYGTTANCNEGGANAPAPSTTTADLRAMNGCTDTDSNSADFTASAPNPRNSATAVAPCGGGMPNLTINDVSLNEGNAGTTSFTFTVSLSAPAGAGGVTFDIATADGTAVAPGDYTAKSLTGQTIPAGSSTYSFTVLVNGDTTPETNETFLVNVANVTGANVTDGQGQGTIQNDDAASNLTINDVSLNEGNAGTTTFTFTVSLSAPAPAGGVTFDIATANGTAAAPGDYTAKSLTGQTIPAGSSTYTFDVLGNGDTTPETDETFLVNVTNATNAIVTDGQGQGTIVNDDLSRIHDVQGNGAATPIPGATVSVEGVVTANFQGASKLQGFFLQEEDADADADPATSEGILIFCGGCATPVAEGQRVRATGAVSEFNNMTEITASAAGSVVVTDAGNHLAEVTPAAIDLPIAGDVNAFYEAREGMKVTFVDTLTVSEYFELVRFGQIVLYEGGRPFQFTETSAPGAAGLAAHLDNLSRREVILDDDNNAQEAYLSQPDGLQAIFHPRANGGFSIGTQGTDFFRGGDLVNGLTGVLHWSFPGFGTDTWRIRPTAANPATFTVANPRPATPPAVGGAIKAVSMNLLNYFTTIDTTPSNSTGPCGPGGTLDCRGADSVAELNRQRERASVVICALNADVYGFMELENTTATATINDLLGAVNARCGGAHPYAFVNTGGTLGTDAIRVMLVYRTGILSPVGSVLVDLDPVHNRPPTAQTFDVVDVANPAFGQRFTVIANHFKSKGCPGTGADADAGDGQSCFNGTRTAQASRLLTWVNGTVVPAAGDPDVLLLGDFNAYAKETPVTTLISGGYTDVESALLGPSAYSYLFDGQLGHLDYAFASASLFPKVTGVGAWHINADEADVFDYNDEVRDTGEAAFEEKPDGSALVPPRVVFQPATAVRASDHDPVLVGLFAVADLSVTKTDGVATAVPGGSVTYTITASNAGPDPVTGGTVADTFPAILTCTWTCVGAGGGTCTASGSGNINNTVNLPVGASVTYTATCAVSSSATGTLTNTATVSGGAVGDSNTANNSATDTDTLTPQANLGITKTDGVTAATAGGSVTYTITASNAGPSNATGATVADTFPASLTCTWTCVGAGGGTCTAAGSGNINGTVNLPSGGSVTYTASCAVSAAATGTLANTATVTAPAGVTDPTPGNNSATDTDTLGGSADLSVIKTDAFDPAVGGINFNYTITVTNAGPSSATSASLSDTLPAGTTFVSLSSPAGWSCTTPAVGAGGTITCSNASLAVGSAAFTLTVAIAPSTTGTISNTATVSSATTDPVPGNNSSTATTLIGSSADISVTKVDTPDPVQAGANLTYTITVGNAGPSNAPTVSLSDTLAAGTTFVSLSSPGGWSCTTPAVGAGGTVICTNPSVPLGSAVFTLTVQVASSVANGTVISNTATVTEVASDLNPGNESATATTTVTVAPSPATVTGTKTATGTFQPGSTVTYTIVLNNSGTGTQQDNPGNELTDVLPASLTLVSATATSGAAVATVGTNTVTWNGSIPAGGSVTITIQATINSGTAQGTTISNQGAISYDADGNGTNEASGVTDSPATGGAADPTTFVVGPIDGPPPIPTLDEVGLMLLALLLAMGGAVVLRRRRA